SRRLGRQPIESESRMVPRSREGMWPDPQEEAGSGQPRAGLFTLLRPLTDQILSRPTRYLNAEEQSPASDIQLRVLRVPLDEIPSRLDLFPHQRIEDVIRTH